VLVVQEHLELDVVARDHDDGVGELGDDRATRDRRRSGLADVPP
jgi:hypothetical protein